MADRDDYESFGEPDPDADLIARVDEIRRQRREGPDPISEWQQLQERRRQLGGRWSGNPLYREPEPPAEGQSQPEVGTSHLARELESTITGLTAEHAARRREETERAIEASRIGAEGRTLADRMSSVIAPAGRTRVPGVNPFALFTPQTNQEFAEGERAWGQRMESIYRGTQSLLEPMLEWRRRAIEESGSYDPMPGVGPWFLEHMQRGTELAIRRQREADEILEGLRAGPRSSYARHLAERTGHGVVDGVVANLVKGIAYTGAYFDHTYTGGRPLSEIEENGLYRVGATISEWAKQLFSDDLARQHEFSGRLAEGFGSMIGFMGPGLAMQMVTRAGPQTLAMLYGTTSGFTGAAAQIGQMTDEARQALREGRTVNDRPVTEQDVLFAFRWAPIIGASEAAPIAHLFNRSGGRPLLAIILQSIEEGGQEWGQQVASNLVARASYDDRRRIDEGAWEGLLIGGILGAGMQGTMELGRRREARLGGRSTTTEPTPPAAAPAEPPRQSTSPPPAQATPEPAIPVPEAPVFDRNDPFALERFGRSE